MYREHGSGREGKIGEGVIMEQISCWVRLSMGWFSWFFSVRDVPWDKSGQGELRSVTMLVESSIMGGGRRIKEAWRSLKFSGEPYHFSSTVGVVQEG
jgi:hypothetical protein